MQAIKFTKVSAVVFSWPHFEDFLLYLSLYGRIKSAESVSCFFIIVSLNKSPTFLLCKFCRKAQFPHVSGDSHETIRKLCLSTKFPHQKTTWNYGMLCSVSLRRILLLKNISFLIYLVVISKIIASYMLLVSMFF